MKLHNLIDTAMLANEIDSGYVTERYHPEFGELAILNYTDKAQFDSHWNSVTKVTRGLIYNRKTGEVVARGLPKFFNYGDEAHTGQLDPDTPILGAYEKWDGSLGIRYRKPDGTFAIATRGSFMSVQALHATELLESDPSACVHPVDGVTDLFEIIFPENRIVVDYGGMDELIHLGRMHVESGAFRPVGKKFSRAV